MKKYLLILAGILALASCKKPVATFIVTVKADESKIGSEMAKPEQYSFKMTNVSTLQEFTAESAGNQTVFSSILPGVYNISVSGKAVSGGRTYSYAGTLSNVEILEAKDVSVPVEAVVKSALLFKEIYYTGCKFDNPSTGKSANYFKDQFYEIYNNSDETVYVDGLCLTILYDVTTNASYEYKLPEGAKLDDYVFTQVIWQVPGNGKQYPLKPGESFVIAQQALNHKLDGNTYGKSLDLSKADFETITEGMVALGNVTDNPDVPNLNLPYYSVSGTLKQWLTSVFGCYYAIFYPDSPIDAKDEIAAFNGLVDIPVMPIAKTCIVDAVEALKNEAAIKTKKIFSPLDNGYIICSSSYCFESIARKSIGTSSVLADTNNSIDDFEVKTDPQIRRNGAAAPAWK